MLKRALISLLLSSIVNVGMTILWVSPRSFWQYDWQVDGVNFLFWSLLSMYGFSALGLAMMLPVLAFLAKRDMDARLRLVIAFTVAAAIGYLIMSWAPKVALLGAICAIVTTACLRLVAPSFFLRSVDFWQAPPTPGRS